MEFEQIKVLESSDDYSGSDNSNVRESSEEGEFCAGNKINIPRSVSEHDNDLSQEPSEDVKNSGDSSTEERSAAVCRILNCSDSFLFDIHSFVF